MIFLSLVSRARLVRRSSRGRNLEGSDLIKPKRKGRVLMYSPGFHLKDHCRLQICALCEKSSSRRSHLEGVRGNNPAVEPLDGGASTHRCARTPTRGPAVVPSLSSVLLTIGRSSRVSVATV
jgi:hypothetical protein